MIDKIQLSRYNTKSIQGQRRLSSYYPNSQDNLLSNYLNSLYNNSPTHQCIIDDIAQQITGLGLTTDNKDKQTILYELLGKKKVLDIVRTYLIQNALNIQIKRNPLKDIVKLENINPAQFRVVEMTEGTPSRLSYRADWNPQSTLYNTRNSYFNTYNNEDEISILYYYDSGTYFTPYGRPSYLAAADAIELEIAIYMMHNHGAQNGMFPSMVVSKETSGDDELDRADSEETQKQTAGAANAGKIVTTYYPKGGNAPTFSTPNLTGLDKIYSEQYLSAEIGIVKAWRIPSVNLISGLNSKSSGFTSETEELAYAKNELFTKIVAPNREDILDILNPIFKELEIEDVYFKDVEEEVSPSVDNVISIDSVAGQTSVSDAEKEIDPDILINKEASYNGAQIASALSIMQNVNEGILNVEQAKSFLVQMLQFSPELADNLFLGVNDTPAPNAPITEQDLTTVNESVKNLTGRQMQGIERIVRKFEQSKLTESQAKLMLQSGYGFTESEALVWLQTEEQLSALKLSADFDDDSMLESLEGEEIDLDKWELVDTREANEEDCEEWANKLIKPKLTRLESIKISLAGFVKSAPNKESELDKDYYKIRYSYQGGGGKGKSRPFCRTMMGRTSSGVVYRKEDIDEASFRGVNNELGHNKQNYSLFKFKGGVYCHHFWQEELYRMKDKTELQITRGEEVSNIPNKFEPKGAAFNDAKIKPINMPKRGAY
tara:strand:+ start:4700 stop:6853 length:2154 start_codon:yes stop_codon:yes gene_type:complete